jgi:hypothetical protein
LRGPASGQLDGEAAWTCNYQSHRAAGLCHTSTDFRPFLPMVPMADSRLRGVPDVVIPRRSDSGEVVQVHLSRDSLHRRECRIAKVPALAQPRTGYIGREGASPGVRGRHTPRIGSF